MGSPKTRAAAAGAGSSTSSTTSSSNTDDSAPISRRCPILVRGVAMAAPPAPAPAPAPGPAPAGLLMARGTSAAVSCPCSLARASRPDLCGVDGESGFPSIMRQEAKRPRGHEAAGHVTGQMEWWAECAPDYDDDINGSSATQHNRRTTEARPPQNSSQPSSPCWRLAGSSIAP
jgi:hypothetical protein